MLDGGFLYRVGIFFEGNVRSADIATVEIQLPPKYPPERERERERKEKHDKDQVTVF
jgi:hypothetical protein